MGELKLIGLDDSEASLVRRHLHKWNKSDEQVISPLILAIQEMQSLSHICINEPRWETNVYPLYYWAERAVGSRKSYEHVLELLPNLFPTSNVSLSEWELRSHLKHIVTAENHNIYGGLGSAVAEVLVEHAPAPMMRVGIQDCYGECGGNEELLDKYCMSPQHIAKAAKSVLERHRLMHKGFSLTN